LPDVNLLVYAYNRDARHHRECRAWWERLLSSSEPVGLPWAVSCGFIRLMTHPSILVRPLDPSRAVAHVGSWLARPNVEVLEPGHYLEVRRLREEIERPGLPQAVPGRSEKLRVPGERRGIATDVGDDRQARGSQRPDGLGRAGSRWVEERGVEVRQIARDL